MPLVRFAVRNEYGLGVPELYNDAVQEEDPKAVLDGLAVAGLVGLLRQLGDLAEFASEVFHGLQEHVASTASRSRKLATRVQRVEASLPQLEKAILSQTSHIHFAYTPGSEWHARIRNEQNHFICDDLPHYIMDSYEECREPPRLQLLDRFDTGGPGSCLKRYSDPNFFRRASARSEVPNGEKSQHERKARKIKRRRSWKQSGRFPNCATNLDGSGSRMGSSSPTVRGKTSVYHTRSTCDTTSKSDLGGQLDACGSNDGIDFTECVFYPSTSMQPDDTRTREVSSGLDVDMTNAHESAYSVRTGIASTGSPARETTIPRASSVSWDEKMEIVDPVSLNYGIDDILQDVPQTIDDIQDVPQTNFVLDEQGWKPANMQCVSPVDDLSEYESPPKSKVDGDCPKAIVDSIQDVPKTNSDINEQELKPVSARSVNQVDELSEHGSTVKELVNCHCLFNNWNFVELSQPTKLDGGVADVQDMLENFELHDHDMEPANMESRTQVANLSEAEDTAESIANQNDTMDRKLGTTEVHSVLETNFDNARGELEAIGMENVSKVDAFSEDANAVTVIEWGQLDDLDSETDHFVDALNTIESESESDFEGQTRKEITLISSSKDDLVENTINEQKGEIISCPEPEHEYRSVFYDHKEEVPSNSQNLTTQDALVEDTIHEQKKEIISHQEPEYECHSLCYDQKDEVPNDSQNLSSKDDLVEDTLPELKEEIISCQETEHESHSLCYDHKEEVPNDLQTSTALVPVCYDHREDQTDDSQQSAALGSVCYDHKEENLGNLQHSTALVSSADIGSVGPAQSSFKEPAAVEAIKLDDSAGLSEEKSAKRIESSSDPNKSQDPDPSTSSSMNKYENTDFCANKPGFPVTASKLQVSADEDTSFTSASQVSVGPSCSYPLAFWTNGTLLGLAPSKPTVFSATNAVNSDPMSSSNNFSVGQLCPDVMQKVDNCKGTFGSSAQDPKCVDSSKETKLKIGNQDVGFSKHVSRPIPDKKHDNLVVQDQNNLTEHSVIDGLSNGKDRTHETKVPLAADMTSVSSGSINSSEDNSSLLSLLGRGLLKNGLRRTESLSYDEKPKTSNPLDKNSENGSHAAILQSTPQIDLKEKLNSPVYSPPPSPPLEHMKISFQPIDGFETSRLKLKYPEGVDNHEMSIDTFPSFQLVPEPTDLKHGIGSDSDDDTFCRSYACMSDDYLSHLSDSNSEEWESGDTSESNDHTLYDGLRRISSTESTSSSHQHEQTAHGSIDVSSTSVAAVHSESFHSFDLPTLDTKNPFVCHEKIQCLNPEAESSQQLTPQTLPLPPLQWRVAKPLLYVEGGKPYSRSDGMNQSFDSNLSGFSVPHVANMESANVLSTSEATAMISKKANKLNEQKSNSQIQINQAANGERADDKGDFLHQIRTKSFNLRRTKTARMTSVPSVAASNKITAILQKANAIRQAVGSDCEDDSWSDT